MTSFEVRLPDVGEGVAEAELLSWSVEVGDQVTPASALAEVMTDKATVEVACPVTGTVVSLYGEPGDRLAVGSQLVTVELDDAATTAGGPPTTATADGSGPADASGPAERPELVATVEPPAAVDQPAAAQSPARPDADAATTPSGGRRRAAAAPAVRARARELGLDLAAVLGTGPEGRVTHVDLDRHLLVRRPTAAMAGSPTAETVATDEPSDEPTRRPVRGLRRRIAERLSVAWREIPHITYVDEVDATQLEDLRSTLNTRDAKRHLTLLPFVVRAVIIACTEQPGVNARFDAAAETLELFDAIHVGIATQTAEGLMVPVVRDAQRRGIDDLAAEITRVSTAARDGRATLSELSGSTITVTSLGALGGLVTTPIINHPEVAIVGVNRLQTRPQWRAGHGFEPRQMMNLSSSFDHRIVDGWDAAVFVQRIKQLLEQPALLYAQQSLVRRLHQDQDQ
jgi:2-oxoisovalerate dehydrogenase E2 component (dihydrolipoyl transacylase)